MKKNQGISLISLIITIIVIIILAAIVIFTGFGTLSKAQLADFAQQVASLNDAALNCYAKFYGNNGLDRLSRTPEQVYYKVATGKDLVKSGDQATTTQYYKMYGYAEETSASTTSAGFQPIVNNGTDTVSKRLGMSLPNVRNFTNGWCITSNGQVFNASGFYDSDSNRTYFSANIYAEGQIKATEVPKTLDARAKLIAEKIIAGTEGSVAITNNTGVTP